MRVGKAATTMRKMHSKHSYVFGEENERLVTLRKKILKAPCSVSNGLLKSNRTYSAGS